MPKPHPALKEVLADMRPYFKNFHNINKLSSNATRHVLSRFVPQAVQEVSMKYATRMHENLMKMCPRSLTISDAANDRQRFAALCTTTAMNDFLADPTLMETSRYRAGLLHRALLHLPFSMQEVDSRRPWAPSMQRVGRCYIPYLFHLGGPLIKQTLKRMRDATRQHLTKLITDKLTEGWWPLMYLHDCAQLLQREEKIPRAATHQPSLAVKLAQQRLKDMPLAFPHASSFSYGDCAMLGSDTGAKMTFLREEPDPFPNQNKRPRLHRLIHKNVRCTIHDDTDLTCQVVEDIEHDVLVDNTYVPKQFFDETNWTLATLMSSVENAEQRRVLMARFGLDKLVSAKNSKTLDVDSTSVMLNDPESPTITRALLEVTEKDLAGKTHKLHVVVSWDGSTDRVYHMSASMPTNRGEGYQHVMTLKEWDALVGQPERLYAQA